MIFVSMTAENDEKLPDLILNSITEKCVAKFYESQPKYTKKSKSTEIQSNFHFAFCKNFDYICEKLPFLSKFENRLW